MTSPMAPTAAENRRDLKKETSSIGWDECRSQIMNRVSTASAAAMAPRMSGEVHERFGASMIPHSNSPMPTMDRPAPIGSERLVFGFFELGTSQTAANSPISAMGTLTRNTEPHQK